MSTVNVNHRTDLGTPLKITVKPTQIYMTNMLQQILTRSVKESEVKSDSGSESAE